MCHVTKNTSVSVGAVTASVTGVLASPVTPQRVVSNKSNMKLTQFRKMAKSARVNLNKYWGLLSPKDKPTSKVPIPSFSMDFSEEEEQNRINELLEAQANAEEQNSINSQIEYDSSPEQPRRLFVRQRALASSYSSFSSSSSSSCPHHHLQSPYYFDDTISQDSVFF